MSYKVGVVGLGSMGYGMASSLLNSGVETYGFDRVESQQQAFVNEGGKTGVLSDVVGGLDALVLVVVNAAQLESILLGEQGVLNQMKAGSVIVACPTIPPQSAGDLEAKAHASNVHYLDAPISGGAAKAAIGQLSIMASGTAEAFAAAKPVLEATAQTVFELGDAAGNGSAMKAVNQMLAGIHIAAMAEAMTFGIGQGIEPQLFLDVISKCAGTSWMLENRAPHIVDGDYTPNSAVDIWPKDLGIVSDMASAKGFDAPITRAALEQFTKASRAGLGGEDDAAVAKIYAKQAGLTLPKT